MAKPDPMSPEDQPYTTIEVASLNGLAVRSVQLMVDRGELDAWKTPGGHRRISRASVERWLAERGPALVGVDAWNIDDTGDAQRPAHTILLGADVVICEHMCALDQLPAAGFRFSAVAPRIAGGTSFPVRAYARVE